MLDSIQVSNKLAYLAPDYSFYNRNEKKFRMEKGIKVSSPGCSC